MAPAEQKKLVIVATAFAFAAVSLQGCGIVAGIIGGAAQKICEAKSGELVQSMKTSVFNQLAEKCKGTTNFTVNGKGCDDLRADAGDSADEFGKNETEACVERFNNITDVTKLHDLVSSYFNSTKAAFDEKKDGLINQVTGDDGAGDEAEDEGSNDARLYDASLEIPAPGILTTGHMVGFVASAALIALLGLGALRLARRPDNSQSLMSGDSEDSEDSP